jgi:hypothetical protein
MARPSRVPIHYQQARGLKRFCSVRGSKAQEYVDTSSLADEALDKIGQIPKGRQNGFDLEPNDPWQQNHCSRRVIRLDIFAILTPRACW